MSTVVPVVAFAALAVSWLVADETPTPQEPLSKVLYSHFPRNFRPEGGTSPPYIYTSTFFYLRDGLVSFAQKIVFFLKCAPQHLAK